MEELDAAGVDADVVRGPAAAELLAAGGELPDEVREVPVVGVAAAVPEEIGQIELLDIPSRCGLVDAFGRGRVMTSVPSRGRPTRSPADRAHRIASRVTKE